MKLIYNLFLAALLAGCVTPSAPPVTVMINAPAEKVRAVAITHLVERGWTPTRGDSLILNFQRDLPFGAQIFVQELGGQPARHQITITCVPREQSTQLFGHLSLVTTRFGNPQRHENRQRDAEVVWLLEVIRAKTLGEPIPPEPVRVVSRAKSPKGK